MISVLSGYKYEQISIKKLADPNTRYSFTGGPFGSDLKTIDYTEKGVRIIQLQNIGDGKFINDYKIYTSEEKANQLKTCNIFPGDIIIAKMADPLARACLIPLFERKYVMASDGIRLKVDESRYDSKFIVELINSFPIRKKAIRLGTGTTRLRIGLTDLAKITMPVPTLPVQKKIAEILSTWDYAIELKSKLIDTQTQLQNAVIQHIKRGKLEINVNSSKWEKCKLKEIFGVRKKRFFISDNLPLYSFTIQEGVSPKTDRYNREFLVVGKKQYKITKYNDLVYNPANLKYGAISVNKNEDDVLISPIYETLFIKDTKKYNIDYFKYFLTTSEMIKYYKSKVEGTLVERSAVKVDAFLLFSFSIPSFEEQNQIARILDTLSKNIQLLKNELTQLELQKKGLMQQLLTGKIRVQC